MWALPCNSYNDVPDKLLYSSIQHPDLTIDRLNYFHLTTYYGGTLYTYAILDCFHSEKHLCDAVLVWLAANIAKSEGWGSSNFLDKV